MPVNSRSGWTLAVTAALVSIAWGGPAWACRCREPGPQQAYSQADSAILAEIESVEGAPEQSVVYTVRIDESWKAPLAGRIRVRSGGTCIYRAEPGRRYVLFLRPFAPGMLQTSVCMGNRPEEQASTTLRLLRSARNR